MPAIVEAMREDGFELTATLTDRYPSADVLDHVAAESSGRITRLDAPIDATNVPRDLHGFRTLFSALHHFRPDDVRRILADAVEAQQPIAAFEVVSRSPVAIIAVLLSPIPVMLLMPFLKPFRWSWLFFTWVFPLIPLFVVWDGVVSCLRAYTLPELSELTRGLDESDGFVWELGGIPLRAGLEGSYLIGLPRDSRPIA